MEQLRQQVSDDQTAPREQKALEQAGNADNSSGDNECEDIDGQSVRVDQYVEEADANDGEMVLPLRLKR